MIPGACLVDMSSIPPAMAREHAAWLSGQGLAALDGPVSGGVVGAREGTLAIMVGGDPVALESVRGPLSELGRVTHVGPAGSGQLAKLANQVIVGITIGAVAEALLLAARGGADPAAVRAAIRGGFAESRILELHGARMLAEDFTPGGSVLTQLKDLATALEEARMTELQLPITGLLHTLFAAAGAHGDGGLDHSALLRELARENALPLHDILSRRDAQA
jgi:2-hydroxy-3-oxopropionate reductase